MGNNKGEVPAISTSEFDSYLFSDWKPQNYEAYSSFHITRIEYYKKHLKIPVLPHRRAVNFFIFLTKGEVIRSKGLNRFTILPNHFYFLPANQITSLEYISEEVEGFYCHFSSEIFHHRLLKVNLSHDFYFFKFTAFPLVKILNTAKIVESLERLKEKYESGDKKGFETIPFYLLLLFMDIKNQADISPVQNLKKSSALVLTELYVDAIGQFILQKKNVADYAHYLAVTPNHLHKCVKLVTGKSAHNLLSNLRLLEAKVLLKQTNLTIGEIAFKVGKTNQSDFSRFFKSQTGVSPNLYRNPKND